MQIRYLQNMCSFYQFNLIIQHGYIFWLSRNVPITEFPKTIITQERLENITTGLEIGSICADDVALKSRFNEIVRTSRQVITALKEDKYRISTGMLLIISYC